ncbi:hypothetical protein HJG60_009479 [Phyllostomus discolor]|uniref:Uncharacterized protein n=1 Tax=Phyllostomus discolor TaxID=89673 RepID=A0A834DC44_9CHIR|nr:hypothetical protein HJG60_009479 [Phyllostomus discolor]
MQCRCRCYKSPIGAGRPPLSQCFHCGSRTRLGAHWQLLGCLCSRPPTAAWFTRAPVPAGQGEATRSPCPLPWQTPCSSPGAPPPDNSSSRKSGATAHSREWELPTRLASMHLLGHLQRSPNLPVTTAHRAQGTAGLVQGLLQAPLGPGRPPRSSGHTG